MADEVDQLDTEQIKSWRSILTLVVFVITNIIVISPFDIPIYVPRPFYNFCLDILSKLRIISPRRDIPEETSSSASTHNGSISASPSPAWVRLKCPMNFVTAPLIADLFLLAISAIHREEVSDGTRGKDGIYPYDIMIFFITLAYIAISIDASGLIRYLAFRVLKWGGKNGNRLFFYLYAFFFCLGTCIGNDPIILSGTAFLAYMTRVSRNIEHPRAWIYSQFAIANIASAILVSSNPTNLVLAGAFNVKFVVYTANMVVPVVVTAIVLFPFLLYIIFASDKLIPYSIEMHELPENLRAKKPVNPNIPHARGTAEEEEMRTSGGNDEQEKLLSLEEIMNPFLDKQGAAFGAFVMAATLITVLGLNAATSGSGSEHPVYWVTLPGAFVMLCFDLGFGWVNRHTTRSIAHKGRREVEEARMARARKEEEAKKAAALERAAEDREGDNAELTDQPGSQVGLRDGSGDGVLVIDGEQLATPEAERTAGTDPDQVGQGDPEKPGCDAGAVEKGLGAEQHLKRKTLVMLVAETYTWLQETFPTVTVVLSHLPFALLPFAFAMFVLVQALVTKGWVPVFAYGWDHWVEKTGTVGAIGGMGFLSVILCNFAGTNIGTTILLCRVIQAWQEIHRRNGVDISDRTFWATVYSMALGVNFGAFSTAFSASLAGLLWRDILSRKHIRVGSLDFARVNLPIIAIAMTVGCSVLVGEIYIIRKETPYSLSN
ncbi:hypothetical protein B0T17DRAFT_488444 [Bombardia bombarda]|uniref:Citrate transporter-like domain-containing protein n=1 Tax=Bombardia bombarda TaxID=252184 RepID=A0AA40CAR6_9PEZI|nr:hypothetical protein B0T17DRAFT_488444 [Bombardia bombarda]